MKKRFFRLCSLLLSLSLLAFPTAAEEEGTFLPTVFRHGDYESGEGQKRVAITFDDGPHRTYTEQILNLLDEYHIRATFFVVGQNVQDYPDLVRREIAAGHEVGNHTLSHPDLNGISEAELVSQLQKTDDIIRTVTGSAPTLFRPPTGVCTGTIKQAASVMHYDLILWSVDPRDWSRHSSVDHIISEVKENVRDGSVILFHDYTVRDDGATVTALRTILPYLIDQGYTFCTVSELLPAHQ